MGPACLTKLIFFFGNGDGDGDGYILDKWFAMSIQALNARYRTVGAAGCPKFIRLHRNFPMLTYGQTTTSNDVTAEEYERYCQLLEELASMLKKGDGEAVESFLFSAVDWRECLDTVRFPRKPKKISCAHGIALFILFGAQPTATDDTGSTT